MDNPFVFNGYDGPEAFCGRFYPIVSTEMLTFVSPLVKRVYFQE